MNIDLQIQGHATRYVLLKLCARGGRGDYQAFPTVPLGCDVATCGRRLVRLGVEAPRTNGERLVFDWRGAKMTMFKSGRILLEGVAPDRAATAAEWIETLVKEALGERRQ